MRRRAAALALLAAGLLLTWARAESAGRDIRGQLESGGIPRSYLLHVPAGYDARRPGPLVLALHGGGGQGQHMPGLTGLSALADRQGFLVAYPDGVSRSWNDGRQDPDIPAQRRGVDDVAFLTALIDRIAAAWRVDPARVYATGISNGGFMSQRLACESADRLAAVATVVATIGVELASRCRPARPVPMLMIVGRGDPLVPFAGGQIRLPGGRLRQGRVASVQDMLALWVRANGCAGEPEIGQEPDRDPGDGVTVRRQTYQNCARSSEVRLYVMEGGGHVWPGGPQYLPLRIIGRTTRDIDSAHIWEFFARHPRP